MLHQKIKKMETIFQSFLLPAGKQNKTKKQTKNKKNKPCTGLVGQTMCTQGSLETR